MPFPMFTKPSFACSRLRVLCSNKYCNTFFILPVSALGEDLRFTVNKYIDQTLSATLKRNQQARFTKVPFRGFRGFALTNFALSLPPSVSAHFPDETALPAHH